MLHRNVGGLDRALWLAAGIVLLPLGLFLFDAVAGGIVGLVLAGIGAWALATGAAGFCLLYLPLHISTARQRQAAPAL